MRNKEKLQVELETSPVEQNESWVSGEITTTTTAGTDLTDPHLTSRISVSVWNDAEGGHSIHLDRDNWVYLSGVWGESLYSNTELLRARLSLAEIRLIHETLGEFIKGVETGTLSTR